jgi:hypothetical protein
MRGVNGRRCAQTRTAVEQIPNKFQSKGIYKTGAERNGRIVISSCARKQNCSKTLHLRVAVFRFDGLCVDFRVARMQEHEKKMGGSPASHRGDAPNDVEFRAIYSCSSIL